MKRFYLLALLMVPLLFTSCAKEYGHYSTSRLEIFVDPTDALYNLDEVTDGDFMLDAKHILRVQTFIYDDRGNLFDHQQTFVKQYTEKPSFRYEAMPLGEYTIITTTDVLDVNGKADYRALYWEFTGTDKLSTFAAHGLDNMDSMGERMLTLTQSFASITGRRKNTYVSVDVVPVTAMVCVTYFDIFFWDRNVVGNEKGNRLYSYFDVTYQHDYNMAVYVPNRKESPWQYVETTSENDYYILDRIYPDKLAGTDINSIYSYHALLPGEYSFNGYGEYKYSGSPEVFPDETRASMRYNVRPGFMYYIDFDIKNWTIAFEPGDVTRAAAVEDVVEPRISLRSLGVETAPVSRSQR